MLKPVVFLGDSRNALRGFPDKPRQRAGLELRAVQGGFEPDNWKSMATIGAGVRELRIRDTLGAYRVIYLATFPDCVLVLHALQKKSQHTARKDIDLATARLKSWRARQ